jgi:hypothetical protein
VKETSNVRKDGDESNDPSTEVEEGGYSKMQEN